MQDQFDCIVVGGGAAGLFAAGLAAARGRRVLLLDKNSLLGKKIMITGKGRCNLTNACEPHEAIQAVPKNGKFLYSSFHSFPPEETMRFFESHNIPLKIERGRRVFPVSDRAKDIVDALVAFVREAGVTVLKDRVTALRTNAGKVIGVQTENGLSYAAGSVLLACGGASYPATGSSGDGYHLAKAVGHQIVPIVPSLVPLVEKGAFCKSVQGLALKNCRVTVWNNIINKPVYEDFGELMFTHFGLSGPVILSASAHMKEMKPEKYTICIDLKPALDEKKLDLRLLRELEAAKTKHMSNAMKTLLPMSLIQPILDLSDLAYDTKCNEVSREMRMRLLKTLKTLKIPIQGFRPIAEAIITSGGVDCREIGPKTMESKKVSGLFFAGELIDVDAYTGGYNLQIAFSTGFCAAQHM